MCAQLVSIFNPVACHRAASPSIIPANKKTRRSSVHGTETRAFIQIALVFSNCSRIREIRAEGMIDSDHMEVNVKWSETVQIGLNFIARVPV